MKSGIKLPFREYKTLPKSPWVRNLEIKKAANKRRFTVRGWINSSETNPLLENRLILSDQIMIRFVEASVRNITRHRD